MKVTISFLGCHRRGGVERILFECARFLASRGHGVTVLANEWDRDETQATIRYCYVPMRKHPAFLTPNSYFSNATRELGKLTELDPGILNTHGCVCPLNGVHWVQSVHRAWLNRSRLLRGRYSASGIKQRLNPIHPAILRLEKLHFQHRNYRKLLATTDQVRSDLNRIYGVPLEDVEIVPNGFAPCEFSPERRESSRAEMRSHLGLAPDNIALLFVANELERKGYTTILAAIARLKRPDIRLLVVGRTNTEDVRRLAGSYGVSDQVIACGSTTNVAGFHAASDLFVLPTQYEAFCLAILEFLGSGLPVVTTNVPGARDAIIVGRNGALISDPTSGDQLADAIEPFLEREYREQISSAAPDTVREYQWPTVLERYEEVLTRYEVQ